MNLILEIGCEELPASAIQVATEFLPKQLSEELKSARLDFEAIESFGTPRRLLLLVLNLSASQKDLDSEVLGPKVEIAFNATGQLTPAGLGFLKARNISPESAYQKTSDKGTVLAAKIHEKGRPALAVLSELLPKLILQIPFAKTMRWEKSKTRFARPIRWLLCLLDNQVVPFEIAGVTSSNKTCGHRFMSPDFQTVTQETYFDFLKQNNVIFDREKRKALILEKAHELAKSVGGHLNEDAELLNTVANLVEYPWPILGNFDADYLKIPQEILICEMREHQKYFSILDSNQNLLPYFIIVAGAQPIAEKQLAAGNARVLKARFADGAFYYEEDLKKKLTDFITEPPQKLIDWALKLDNNPNLKRAAYLCKADLNTGVVGQFPELQGIMGSIYAHKNGENAEVVQALREQYWPRFSGDKTPSTKISALLSLADRLHTLTYRKLPKGSADPYGLRRAAIGLTRIILDKKFKLNLQDLISNAEVLDFVMTRAKGVFLESTPVLVVEATQTAANYDLCAWQARIGALEKFDYAAVSAVFKRVSNIVAKNPTSQGGTLKEPSEIALLKAVGSIQVSEDFAHMLSQLANLKPLLDTFFAEVMVMTDDLELRQARLNLLAEVQHKAAHVADFSKLTL
ncbi:MAG: glycine--tRNA ligase subunit beta [Myxococcaceae bacterium]